jgi:hypothetical protein
MGRQSQEKRARLLAAVTSSRQSLVDAEGRLWRRAGAAREAGATLAEIAAAAGVAIETVRRRLGEGGSA